MSFRVKSLADLPQCVRELNTVARPESPKPRRYLNEPVDFDGHHFDSKSEWSRYLTLKAMEQSGLIQGLRVHPEYPLNAPNGELVGKYIGDFDYQQDGKLIVEDCKSPRTAELGLFRHKYRHVFAQYGIEIRMVVKRWKKSAA